MYMLQHMYSLSPSESMEGYGICSLLLVSNLNAQDLVQISFLTDI